MKKEIQVKTVTEDISQYVKKTIEKQVLICSDGKQYPLDKKEDAISWQKDIDSLLEFKELIKYQLCDIEFCDHYCPTHGFSFTFEWDNSVLNGREWQLKKLMDLLPNGNGALENGKYLVIQYYDDSGDYYSTDGYFGLLSKYIDWLAEILNKAKAL